MSCFFQPKDIQFTFLCDTETQQRLHLILTLVISCPLVRCDLIQIVGDALHIFGLGSVSLTGYAHVASLNPQTVTWQEESCGGVGLGPSLLGHTITPTDEDGLAGGRGGGRVQRGAIGFFGWSLHVHFGTHNGVPVPYSGALQGKEHEEQHKAKD